MSPVKTEIYHNCLCPQRMNKIVQGRQFPHLDVFQHVKKTGISQQLEDHITLRFVNNGQ